MVATKSSSNNTDAQQTPDVTVVDVVERNASTATEQAEEEVVRADRMASDATITDDEVLELGSVDERIHHKAKSSISNATTHASEFVAETDRVVSRRSVDERELKYTTDFGEEKIEHYRTMPHNVPAVEEQEESAVKAEGEAGVAEEGGIETHKSLSESKLATQIIKYQKTKAHREQELAERKARRIATAKRVAIDVAMFLGGLGCLYLFLISVDLLGSSLQVLAGDGAGAMFQLVNNYVAGLTIGILVTSILQSSSTTTSIFVSMVGAGILSVPQAIPMVMGANIGTSVTNFLVCLTFMDDQHNYRRAFSAALVHEMFAVFNVAIWFPIEWITDAINDYQGGVLYMFTYTQIQSFEQCDSTTSDCTTGWQFNKITKAVTEKLLLPNKGLMKDYAVGRPSLELCPSFCANTENCQPYMFNDKRCADSIYATPATQCNGTNPKARAIFYYCLTANEVNRTIMEAAQEHYDSGQINIGGVFYPLQWEAGLINFFIAFILLFLSLYGLVKLLSSALSGGTEKLIKKVLDMNGYIAILVGLVTTAFIQSSSVTTSMLIPLAAMGLIKMEVMLPFTLGAAVGTTFTGILASLVGESVDGFQLALVNLYLNIFGVITFYPIPFMRSLPLKSSKALGRLAMISKPVPIIYIVFAFFILPGLFLGLSLLFTIAGTAGIIVGSILLVLSIGGIAFFMYWYLKMGGSARLSEWMERKYMKSTSISRHPSTSSHLAGTTSRPQPSHDNVNAIKPGTAESSSHVDNSFAITLS